MKTGLGIRPELFEPVLSSLPNLGFLEAHSENYFQASIGRQQLLQVREHYPISLHGVGLSLGRADALDQEHLQQLATLINDIEPLFVSEHLAWSAFSHRHLPDLLPLPLTQEAFDTICAHILQMQDHLGRQVLIENPSNYLVFEQLQIPEPEFLNALAARTGCGLLLDINNIHVSSKNVSRSSQEYLAAIQPEYVQQYHLAGHVEKRHENDTLLIDTHNQPVADAVWALYDLALENLGKKPTLFEWDSDFPEFELLLGECQKADRAQQDSNGIGRQSSPTSSSKLWQKSATASIGLAQAQQQFLDSVLQRQALLDSTIEPHRSRISVYQNNTFGALNDYLSEVYPATKGVLGDGFFKQVCALLIEQQAPSRGNIYHYGEQLRNVVCQLEECQGMPYLDDLMAFEWALHQAYFSSVEPPLDTSQYDQESLLTLPVKLNCSVWVTTSAYPIFEIHRQSLPSYQAEVAIDLGQSADSLLVFKRDHQVETLVVEPQTAEFLMQLIQSENLLQAIQALTGSISPEQLSAALATALDLNLLTT